MPLLEGFDVDFGVGVLVEAVPADDVEVLELTEEDRGLATALSAELNLDLELVCD